MSVINLSTQEILFLVLGIEGLAGANNCQLLLNVLAEQYRTGLGLIRNIIYAVARFPLCVQLQIVFGLPLVAITSY